MTSNRDVARALRELADLMTVDEQDRQSFRARAYETAARTIDGLGEDVAGMSEAELVALKGVGKGTATKIRELLATGTIERLERLRERYPPGYLEMIRIPGIGPKTAARLRSELGVATVDELRVALDEQRLREIPGLGPKSEEKIARAIERLGMASHERRTPIALAMPAALELVAALEQVPGVERIEYAGSLRRFRETIGDVDVIVAAREAGVVMEAFATHPSVREVVVRGDTKTSVVLQRGLQADVRVVAPEEYGAALVYFTGSKAHNVHLRQRAIERGLLLNEYGLTDNETGERLAGDDEQGVYAALDLPWISPELREDGGEIEAAAQGLLPEPLQLEHLRGDLHVHTDLSGDGHEDLEAVLAAIEGRGLEFVAITDHAEDLRINGASREEMLDQRARIAEMRDRFPGLTILHGSELNIGPDGGLDYDDEFLAGFDFCVASVHSHFDLDPDRQTARLLKAILHPSVNTIGHLTGRRVGQRPGIELDVETVLDAAAATGTALEINANLDRLDAPAEIIRRGAEMGVVFTIGTDAHRLRELEFARWGVRQARRGWLPPDAVVNTWHVDRFMHWVTAKRSG